MRRLVLGGAALGVGLGGVALLTFACGDIEAPNYGNPNALQRANIPGEGGVEILSCSGDGGGGGDGGCPSFATDIYPYFTATGKWRCADQACHGAASPPPIDGGSPAACLDTLRKASVGGKPYVLSDGGRDPNASALMCNLLGSCGSKMPKPPGQDPNTADLCKIDAWLRCGAPNN